MMFLNVSYMSSDLLAIIIKMIMQTLTSHAAHLEWAVNIVTGDHLCILPRVPEGGDAGRLDEHDIPPEPLGLHQLDRLIVKVG